MVDVSLNPNQTNKKKKKKKKDAPRVKKNIIFFLSHKILFLNWLFFFVQEV